MRALMILGLALLAAPMMAGTIADYSDYVFLHHHETVRYRVDVEHGTNDTISIDIRIRGWVSPPRIRVLDSDKDERREREDTNGDWEIDTTFHTSTNHDHYYIEVDSMWPWDWSEFDVDFEARAADEIGADVDFRYLKIFNDYESGDDSDHYDCAARSGAPSPWWLVLPAGVAMAAFLRRRIA